MAYQFWPFDLPADTSDLTGEVQHFAEIVSMRTNPECTKSKFVTRRARAETDFRFWRRTHRSREPHPPRRSNRRGARREVDGPSPERLLNPLESGHSKASGSMSALCRWPGSPPFTLRFSWSYISTVIPQKMFAG